MHPKVEEAYKKAAFPIPTTPHDSRALQFRRLTRRNADKTEKVINQVWRVSAGKNKEYIMYEQKEIAPDFQDNEQTLTSIVGRYEMPKFRNRNDRFGDPVQVEKTGDQVVFDIPYSKENMKEILESGNSDNTNYVLVVGKSRYGGFSEEDFVNKSFPELYHMAVTGTQVALPETQEVEALQAKNVKEFDENEQENKRLAREAADRRRKEIEEEFHRNQEAIEEETQKRQEIMDKRTGRQEGNKNVESQTIEEDVNFVVKNEDMEASEEETNSDKMGEQGKPKDAKAINVADTAYDPRSGSNVAAEQEQEQEESRKSKRKQR